MGGHDHGHAALGKVTDDGEHFAHQFRVQGGGRLVQQDDLGVHGQGAGHGHALLLAAGKLGGVEQGTAGKAHAGQLVHGAFTGGRGGHAAHLAQGDGHVLFGGQVVEQVEVLEDHAHLGPEGAELGFVGEIQLFAFKDDLAPVRGDEAVDALQERALARTGRTDEDLELAAFHGQGAIVQDGLAAQAFADAFYLQDNFVHAFFTPCCVFLAMLPTVPAE